MLVALVLSTALYASEVSPSLDSEQERSALVTAELLAEQGDTAAARVTLDWLLAQEISPDLRQRAQALMVEQRLDLPTASSQAPAWMARARLIGWEAAAGATVVGAMSFYPYRVDWDGEWLVLGILAGGTLGALSPRLWQQEFELNLANTSTLVGMQQLGIANLGLGALLFDTYEAPYPAALGLILGGTAGTLAGWQLAMHGLSDGEAAGLQAGMFWGAGVAAMGLTVAYAWDEDDSTIILPIIAGIDLGAAGGWALGRYAGLSRQEVRMANTGAVFGAVAAYGFGWATEDSILWTDGSVAVLLGTGALLGGVGGALIVRRYGSPGDEALARVELLPPAPSVTRTGAPALSLLNGRF